MTPKARRFASQKAPLLRTNRIEFEEELISTESAESDPDGAAWAEDRFVTVDPEEIEVLDFDEVKDELGVNSGRGVTW